MGPRETCDGDDKWDNVICDGEGDGECMCEGDGEGDGDGDMNEEQKRV